MLAEHGSHGLSHLKLDRRAGVPDGTTSFYYRTRSALLRGVADQLVRYDLEAFTEAFAEETTRGGDGLMVALAELMVGIREEPNLSRTRARLELTMMSKRDADLVSGFHEVSEIYRSVAERLVVGMQAARGPVNQVLVNEQASALLTFLSGLVFGFANGATEPGSREQVERQIRAVILGVAAAHS